MDAQTIEPDLDIGPAVADLRLFRFAEYILVFLTIVAVSVFAGLYALREEAADLSRQYGSSSSLETLNVALVALGVAIVVGILTYRAAGKLSAGLLRRHRILLPVAGIAFLVTGIIFGMQAERMMHRANVTRFLLSPSVFEIVKLQTDPLFFMQSEETRKGIVTEINEKIAREKADYAARAARIVGLVPAYAVNLLYTFSVFDPLDPPAVARALDIVIALIFLWIVVELGLLRGTQGPNAYGPDPSGHPQADAKLS